MQAHYDFDAFMRMHARLFRCPLFLMNVGDLVTNAVAIAFKSFSYMLVAKSVKLTRHILVGI